MGGPSSSAWLCALQPQLPVRGDSRLLIPSLDHQGETLHKHLPATKAEDVCQSVAMRPCVDASKAIHSKVKDLHMILLCTEVHHVLKAYTGYAISAPNDSLCLQHCNIICYVSKSLRPSLWHCSWSCFVGGIQAGQDGSLGWERFVVSLAWKQGTGQSSAIMPSLA